MIPLRHARGAAFFRSGVGWPSTRNNARLPRAANLAVGPELTGVANQITVRHMPLPHMIRLVSLTTNCQTRHVQISLALVPCLLDGQKYFLPDDPPAPVDDRPIVQPQTSAPRSNWKAWTGGRDLAELERLIGAD